MGTETIPINSEQHNALIAPGVMKRITEDIDVQVTLSEKTIKIRGVSNDVKDIKTKIMEQFTGKFEISMDLEPTQFIPMRKALADGSHFDRIRESTKADLSLDEASSSVIISGKRGNVKKAKNQIMALLEFLFPSQFLKVKVPKPVLKAIAKPALLAKISTDTGANLCLDRELNCIQIRSQDPEEVLKAKDLLDIKISESEKLNIVIRFDSIDAWLIAKIIGRDGATAREIEATSGCKVDVSKSESTVAIQGESPQIASQGKMAVDKVIEQARKENVFISIPDSAMASFIGKGGENIKKLSEKNNVKIERLKKEMSTILIKGNEKFVEVAVEEVLKWLKNWESSNKGVKLHIEDTFIPNVMGRNGAIVSAIQKETGTRIDMNRRDGTLTIRGGNEASRNHAIQKINDIVRSEKEKVILRKNEMSESRENLSVEKVEMKSIEKKDTYVKPITSSNGVVGDIQSKHLDSIDAVVPKKDGTTKPNIKKGDSNTKKVTPQTSQASQSLFNMLISDPTDSPTNGNANTGTGDNGHEAMNEQAAPAPKAKVYKTTSGFSVRV